jgi:hypothetical protein
MTWAERARNGGVSWDGRLAAPNRSLGRMTQARGADAVDPQPIYARRRAERVAAIGLGDPPPASPALGQPAHGCRP